MNEYISRGGPLRLPDSGIERLLEEDVLVTSAPFYAKSLDIQVRIYSV